MMFIVIFSSGDIGDLGQVDDKMRMMFVVIFGDLGQVDDNDDDVFCNLWRPWASRCSLATG